MTTLLVYDGSCIHDAATVAAAQTGTTISRADDSASKLIGRAYITERRARAATAFAFEQSYLACPQAAAFDPEFPLQSGTWPCVRELPGSFTDAAPDRWGRNLINKRHPGRRLSELDYLLGVSDVTRQGALRFKTDEAGPFLFPDTNVPKLIALPQLLDAASQIDNPRNGQEAVRFLLAAGSASMGGARPKAVVMDNGQLYVAKFPHRADETDVVSLEYDALQKAKAAGIDTPEFRKVRVGDAQVLLVKRFDRSLTDSEYTRLFYISAMTALGATDGEQRDYLEIIDFITRHGSRPKADIAELLLRIRLTIEINNTDDHLRNHGFILEKGGWRLAPVFDINANPQRETPRQTSLCGHSTEAASLKALEALERELLC